MEGSCFYGLGEAVSETHGYVASLWPHFIRDDNNPDAGGEGQRIALPRPYVVPNNELFPYLFYWDSYFTIEGMAVDGYEEAIRSTVENLLWEVETYGFVLNYSHPASLSRSQPPYLSWMVKEVMKFGVEEDWLRRAYTLLKKEYEGCWMARHQSPAGLCHYHDWGEPDSERKAQFESGWDFSTRWGGRCRFLAAVDLNCNLYQYEKDLASLARILELEEEALLWEARAEKRRELINRYLFHPRDGLFFDYDFEKRRLMRKRLSLAMFHPLFVGLADPEQACSTARALSEFEHPYGLVCTPKLYRVEGEVKAPFQWDHPNGWAPLHWVVIKGLKNYGLFEDAARIALKWLSLCADVYRETGFMWEKYDVVEGSHEAVSHYPTQTGFGWTNGVFSALLGKVIIGLDKDPLEGCFILEPLIAPVFDGKELGARLKRYYGHDFHVSFRLDCAASKVKVAFSAAPPVSLKLLVKDLRPARGVRIQSDRDIPPYRRLLEPYPLLCLEWDEVSEWEGQIHWQCRSVRRR